MQRDAAALANTEFDVLIVGAGSHGLFAAYDAARRGLRAAVIDRGDFGGGLSAIHQRTLHGGLRALQSRDLAKTRAQIAERRTWARIAPHLITPLPFLFGTYRTLKRSRFVVRTGFRLYDYLARHRNDGVPGELHLPNGRLESAAVTRRLFPGIADDGLTGGAMWYDYQTTQAERLTWCVALAAAEAGATLVNYVEAVGPLRTGTGVQARDVVSGATFDIRARAIVLTAADGLTALHRAFGLTGDPPLLRAMNVLLDRPAFDMAHVAPTATGRMLTAVPWRGFVLVGTGQTTTPVAPGSRASDADVDAFVAEANTAFPYLRASRDDIRLVHDGVVPATPTPKGLDLPRDFSIVRHASHPHVVSVIGAKYTTARLAAERAIDAVTASLQHRGRACETATRPLPHAGVADVEGLLIEAAKASGAPLPADVLSHLAAWYGTEATAVLQFARASAWGDTRLVPESPVLAAEVAYARTHAMAVTPADVIDRRTAIGGAGRVTDAMAARVRAVWDATTAAGS